MAANDFTEGPQARQVVRELESSRIREVANAGFGMEGVLRFWFGESDQPTPAYVRDAAIAALQAGETFYTHNNGDAQLRQAIAAYLQRLHGRAIATSQVAVTSSGMSAMMLTLQALVDPGARVVIVAPVWPNLAEAPRILGAEVVRVSLRARDGRWQLDLDQLLAAITPGTRAVVLNSPGNPTGWTLPDAARWPLIEHCRRLGVWLVADDVYERLVFDTTRACAPSLLALVHDDDRFVSVNSFSKAWLMTGWRIGWLVAPPALERDMGKLLEYNTSCAPGFVQAAARVAITEGEPHVAALRASLLRKGTRLVQGLAQLPGVRAAMPDGGMYVFMALDANLYPKLSGDSVALAKRLLADARVGLAPGSAFGPEGEGWLRWCFAADDAALDEGVARIAGWLRRQ